jgi:hypothetical protein
MYKSKNNIGSQKELKRSDYLVFLVYNDFLASGYLEILILELSSVHPIRHLNYDLRPIYFSLQPLYVSSTHACPSIVCIELGQAFVLVPFGREFELRLRVMKIPRDDVGPQITRLSLN